MKKLPLAGIFASTLFLVFGCDSNNNGTDPVSVGDTYQGGIVFYVDGSGQHGLIAAPSDQSTGIKWENSGNVTTSANGTAIGTGQANTTAIITSYGAGSYAASLCDQLVLDGYSDWYLPSKNELDLMRTKKTTIGGFSSSSYWSSTEDDSYDAWAISFGTITPPQYYYTKAATLRVRAIRSF